MKYIKTLEDWDGFDWIATEEEKQLSRVGNYVIINPFNFATVKEKKFLNTTIGQIIKVERNKMSKIENYYYYVQYKNAPLYVILNDDNTYIAEVYEIVLEYKNKEDLEAKILSKKYNL